MAGVLVSSVAFEFMDEAYRVGGLDAAASGNVVIAIQAFAAGAAHTMLASTMMPEAYEDGDPVVGVVTTIGFLPGFVLSHVA